MGQGFQGSDCLPSRIKRANRCVCTYSVTPVSCCIPLNHAKVQAYIKIIRCYTEYGCDSSSNYSVRSIDFGSGVIKPSCSCSRLHSQCRTWSWHVKGVTPQSAIVFYFPRPKAHRDVTLINVTPTYDAAAESNIGRVKRVEVKVENLDSEKL